MFVEDLLIMIQDMIGENGMDKGSLVFFDTYGCGVHSTDTPFTKDLLYVDAEGNLHIDAAYN